MTSNKCWTTLYCPTTGQKILRVSDGKNEIDYMATPDQQHLINEMLRLRKEYMQSVDTMFQPIREVMEKIQAEHGAECAVDYLYAVCPDCVPRVLAIHSLHKQNDGSL